MNKFRTSALAALLAFFPAAAQNGNYGVLSGSFETNSTWYRNDPVTNSFAPKDHFGSNNYLKLDYNGGKFSAGIQAEGYLPAIQGHPDNLQKVKPTNYYASWQDEDFSVTAGSLYEQFGSGLLFRSWEDRALGINNALLGARFTYNYKGLVRLKGILGAPRFGMEYSDTKVRGLDMSLSVSDMLGWEKTLISLEGSVMDRYEAITTLIEESGGQAHRTGYSARANIDFGGFFAKAEWVDGGRRHYKNPDAMSVKEYLIKRGNAQLVELGYNGNGLGINATLRRIEWLDSPIVSGDKSSSNMLNYVPGLCAQYTYMLENLHPYTPQTGLMAGSGGDIFTNSGETGGQVDIFYNFRRGSFVGGKRGMKIHGNFSTYYTIASEGGFSPGRLLFRNANVDAEKAFGRRFKAYLLYSLQQINPSYGLTEQIHTSHVFVSDMTWKISSKLSARAELQYLHSDSDEKDWVAGVLEVNFAPKWSIYYSDMYNHGGSKVNYYNIGISYAKSRTRIALAYGRNKEGYICSGGVCRIMPAFTGANLSLTTSF